MSILVMSQEKQRRIKLLCLGTETCPLDYHLSLGHDHYISAIDGWHLCWAEVLGLEFSKARSILVMGLVMSLLPAVLDTHAQSSKSGTLREVYENTHGDTDRISRVPPCWGWQTVMLNWETCPVCDCPRDYGNGQTIKYMLTCPKNGTQGPLITSWLFFKIILILIYLESI